LRLLLLLRSLELLPLELLLLPGIAGLLRLLLPGIAGLLRLLELWLLRLLLPGIAGLLRPLELRLLRLLLLRSLELLLWSLELLLLPLLELLRLLPRSGISGLLPGLHTHSRTATGTDHCVVI